MVPEHLPERKIATRASRYLTSHSRATLLLQQPDFWCALHRDTETVQPNICGGLCFMFTTLTLLESVAVAEVLVLVPGLSLAFWLFRAVILSNKRARQIQKQEEETKGRLLVLQFCPAFNSRIWRALEHLAVVFPASDYAGPIPAHALVAEARWGELELEKIALLFDSYNLLGMVIACGVCEERLAREALGRVLLGFVHRFRAFLDAEELGGNHRRPYTYLHYLLERWEIED